MKLVIVESPTKAKTIGKFLGKGYRVESSFGHVRDLPKSTMGIDIEHDFQPKYVIPTKARKNVTLLKKTADKAESVILATDEDREGEAIAWHLITAAELSDNKIERIVFHEITQKAIEAALAKPRGLDMNLVDAQQARRILDRLVGYELSPFLWHKVAKGLSAGRVQSVAVRLIAEREREIQAFKPDEYWQLTAHLKKEMAQFLAKLHKANGKTLDKLAIKDEASAQKIETDLTQAEYIVESVAKKETKKNPLPPFTTSTLQQAGANMLGWSSKQTMRIAQQLYEGIDINGGHVGLITYMRTDSLNIGQDALASIRETIASSFGKEYLPATAKFYKTKSKGAQEAHEAIRPTMPDQKPEDIKNKLTDQQFRLYRLIWQRAVASQMLEAKMDHTTVDIKAKKYIFRTTGSVIKFDGFLKVWPTSTKDEILPELKKGEVLTLEKLEKSQHFTEPPARYNEAGLIKALEEYGIGRPSTYAPTISTIQDRGYVQKNEAKRFEPQEIGLIVNDLLVEHFPQIVDYQFTAKLEEDLDNIAEGKKEWVPIIREFYKPFKENLDKKSMELDKKEITEEATKETCEKCGQPMVIKLGRYGKFLACTGFPDCKNTRPLNDKGEPTEPEVIDEKCPQCGKGLVVKEGRYGKFFGCSGYPECKYIKSKEQSTGVKCPQCGEGEIIARHSKRGKTFYGCNQYPKCKIVFWSKPTGEKCPDCQSLLVQGPKNTIQCSNKACGHKE
ncbi:MAG: type I DNA topoisomerase [bacterium]